MLQGDENYYEQGLRKLEEENDRFRSLVERVATDIEDNNVDVSEIPTLNPDQLRAELNPGDS